jgi:hypothetical protein
MNGNVTKPAYTKPEVRTLSARQVVDSLGVAHAGTYQAILNQGYGD